MIYELFPSNKYLPKPVDECLELYFSTPFYSRTREVLCIRSHFSEDILKDWCIAFNLELIGRGEPEKSLCDWCVHLSRWLKFQDLKSNPKDLFNGSATPKTTASNSRGSAQSFYDATSGFNRKGE